MREGSDRSGGGPRWLGLAAAASFGVVIAAWWNHFPNGFHFDDSHVIEENLWLRSLGNIPRFFTDASTFSSHPPNATYRPLLSVTYAVDYAIAGGLDPVVFHLTQFALHLGVAGAAFLLFRAVFTRAGGGRAAPWLALAGATWFAVHTGNTETVNYLSSRSDVLSTLGLLAGLLLYIRGGAARRYHLYLIPMVAGALAKPPALVLAPLLPLWVLLFEERVSLTRALRAPTDARVRRAVRAGLPAFVAAAATLVFVESMNPPAQTYGGGSPLRYLGTQAWVSAHYFRLFVLPVGLTADTDMTLVQHWYDTRVIVGAGMAVGLVVLAAWSSRRRSGLPVAFGVGWLALVLALGSLIPLAEVANEHRLYLPFLGAAMAAVWGVWLGAGKLARRWAAGQEAGKEARRNQSRLWARHPGAGGMERVAGLDRRSLVTAMILILLIIAHAVGTHTRNRVWRTEETLWADVVSKSPDNARAWMNYGLAHMEAGRLERAEELFMRAASLTRDYPHLETNLAIVNAALGRQETAEAHFRRSLEMDPAFAGGRFFFGRWLLERGRGPEALNQLERAVEVSPGHLAARKLLAELRSALGRPHRHDPDLADLGIPDDSAPSAAEAYNEGVRLTSAERHLEAALAYRRSLELSATADAFNNLGWSLFRLGFTEEAAEAFRDALGLEPQHPHARSNLDWLNALDPTAVESPAANPTD